MYGFHPGTRTYLESKCQFNVGRIDKLINEHKEEYANYYNNFLATLIDEFGKEGDFEYYTIFKIISESENNDFLYAAEITDDDFIRSSIFRHIGLAHKRRGDYKEALEYLNKALEIDAELDNKVGLGHDYEHIGDAHFMDYNNTNDTKTLEYYQKALEINASWVMSLG